ncbi:MAG: hypothetical protein H7122_18695 [Chitinophagaceae bacterium]|nr:hypothetical protein [Chitinophagaceae bacterium]
MKKKVLSRNALIFLALVYLFACSKNGQTEEVFPEKVNIDSILRQESPAGILPEGSSNMQCPNGPKYKDSLIYNESKSGKDHIVKPLNDPGAGKYYSWPQGLVLDSLSGSINVTKSETGLRYIVAFVKIGTKDTCLQTLILSGASYVDSIHILGKNQTTAQPYFDANLQTSSICIANPDEDDDDDDDGNDKCEFSTSNKKVKIKSISGTIDLKKTLENEAFGRNPVNGTAIRVSVYYKLNDKSSKALQKMDVQMVYYEKKSQVPQAVVDYVQQKRSNIINQQLISVKGNPRPPLIVITRS